jgi:tRNA pseudouridine13 synthase
MLARWLIHRLRSEQLRPVALRMGEVPFPAGLDAEQQAELAALHLPLPSSRLKLEPSDPCAELVQSVLAEEQLELHDMQVRGVREMFFSKGERSALCLPGNLTHESATDELHPKRSKLTLAFDMPRGCYATLVVKAATAI